MSLRGFGLLFVICFSDLTFAKQDDQLKRFDRVRVDEHNFGKVRNLHINWYVHSIKALMGQLGKELYANLDKDEQTLLLRCLDKIEDSRDLVESARCLVLSRKRYRLRTSNNEQTTTSVKSSEFHKSLEDLRLRNKTTTVSSDHFVFSAFKLDPNVSTPLVTSPNPLVNKPCGQNITVYRFYNQTANVEVHKPSAIIENQFNLSVEKTSNVSSDYRQNGLRVGPKINRISKGLFGKIFKLKNRLKPKIKPLKISKIDYKPSRHKTLKPIATQSNYYSMRRRYKRNMSWFGQKFLKSRKMQRDEQPLDHNETWKVKKADRVSLLSSVDKSPVSRIANLISTFARTPTQNESETRTARDRVNRWSHTYTKLLNMKKSIEQKESSPGARVYSHRMYDLVLDSERPSMTPKQSRRPEGLVQMAMDLFSRVGGDKSRPEREKSNMKVLSPRFAPLMPDKVETKDSHLSPTFFAFYEEPNNTANIASIPQVVQSFGCLIVKFQILKATGMDKKDSEAVMATIMDVSGARDTVEDAMETLNDLNFFVAGIEGEIMSVTENMAKIYDKLESSMKKQQNKELDKRGFTFLDKHQLNKLYRDSALNLPDEAIDFEDYTNLNNHEREEALWKTIEKIAINEPEEPRSRFNRTRGKRDLTTPSILQPVVLAPFMFAPVTGLNILGPTVLSPNIFSPLILNPAVLAPYVLSPAVAIPFIISPYLLSPYVLSPLVMAPFILNPYVLSPNVINPYVLSPLILSPLVLCPDVLSPMTLGGAILSPSVASPAVFTETFLMANILSPSFLS
ncbi:hypothetical protein M3Y98_00989900 [Aphelenchoides besseyi]|nr:hypothetical protein M3Y98_00989900 [Aphelenchoides besseyi]KAI6194821.1 hypothetical protein M3Y96_01165800 [Aphelenchoides besseyi]